MCSYCGLCVNRTFFQTYVYAPDLITRLLKYSGAIMHMTTASFSTRADPAFNHPLIFMPLQSSEQSHGLCAVPSDGCHGAGSNGPELQLPPWSASDGNEEILCLSHFLSFSRLPFWLFPLFPPSLYLCEHFIHFSLAVRVILLHVSVGSLSLRLSRSRICILLF